MVHWIPIHMVVKMLWKTRCQFQRYIPVHHGTGVEWVSSVGIFVMLCIHISKAISKDQSVTFHNIPLVKVRCQGMYATSDIGCFHVQTLPSDIYLCMMDISLIGGWSLIAIPPVRHHSLTNLISTITIQI